jgi:hypothetical protein
VSFRAGGLIGLGAAIKTVLIVLVLAFLPLAPGWRVQLRLVASAVAVPVLEILPFEMAYRPTLDAIIGYQRSRGGADPG